mmetsp:Transcript_21090/g.34298  ORF Transcript_21090/g.34298 Transcript_21090/m.34298 type:complete len:358 (-) Transcript_21090:252-1325(-)|eukprot:CAMPEP_0196166608 /NCGR_PEP_ID=MMETSP0911-20130528/2077_1 /TAXON_ID=49265 /ORGANISM="Thalassiosira rotula, Strain GSO102" /LENGTH=357 /DNA_ID=CAMNT_0041432279 /DNA_START=192 /DNA_END=1265 /DNA_ORIENTATION=-
MERLKSTFIPDEDPDGSERRTVASQPIIIFKPKKSKKIAGLTFVLTAANMPLSKYASTISALNAEDHVVVGFFINVFNPPRLGNHRVKAERMTQIFQELKGEFRVTQYDVVGHSVGGKIALLAVALYDEDNLIRSVVALDPVDQSPVEFTNEVSLTKTALSSSSSSSSNRNGGAPPQNPSNNGGDSSTSSTSNGGRSPNKNLSLESSLADITLTFTDTGYFISKKHNAREIQKNNPSVKLVMHRNSYHMVYCDDDGLLSWKSLMGRGKSADRNQTIREETLTLIKERAMRSSSSSSSTLNVSGKKATASGKKASGMMQSTVGKARRKVSNGVKELKGMGDEAQKKGRQVAAMSRVMG